MLQITKFDKSHLPSSVDTELITQFLFNHLDEYGDEVPEIRAAIDYALSIDNKPGGFLLAAKEDDNLIGASVVVNTQMTKFIPEHILVYVAIHSDARGKGIGRKLMDRIVEECDGNIALHVDPDNPARRLYERIGFETPYLEMRLQKNK